jgi:uncharacterized protein YciI
MKTLFTVTLKKGSGWNANEPMRSQAHWDEHAALMDEWTADGFILLGGPIGEGEDEVLLVIDATDEDEIRSAFAADPWFALQIRELAQIRQWTILLEAERLENKKAMA